MKRNVRAGIAYIAGRLISGKNCASVFDCFRGKHITIGGTVRVGMVNVLDKDSKCLIVGSGSNGRYSLKHEGIKNYIDLSIYGSTFTGYDFASGKQFNGTVEGGSISIFDSEDNETHKYAI